MRIKRRWRLVVLVAVAIAALGLVLVFVSKKRGAFVTVQAEPVQRRDLTEVVAASGRIQPVTQVVICPEVAGEIVALPVKEGQSVKKGDLLVQIKPDAYIATRNSAEASYKSALAGVSMAMAELEKARTEYNRNAGLFTNGLIPESVFLEYKTAYEAARLRYQMAQHQADQAKYALDKATEDLSKTTIVAPIDGTVTRLRCQVGERVLGTSFTMGTEIMTVANLQEMEARVEVGETDVVAIQPGQKARLEVDAFKDRKFTGTVTEIANSPRQAGQQGQSVQTPDIARFEVRIRIHEKEAFRPGMSVSAEIETRYRTNVLAVPLASVTTRTVKSKLPTKPESTNTAAASAQSSNAPSGAAPFATGPASGSGTNAEAAGTNAAGRSGPMASPRGTCEVVFVVEGDRVRVVPVKLGICDDKYWEVVDGLREGQLVVVGDFKAVSRLLEDGMRVRVSGATGKGGNER